MKVSIIMLFTGRRPLLAILLLPGPSVNAFAPSARGWPSAPLRRGRSERNPSATNSVAEASSFPAVVATVAEASEELTEVLLARRRGEGKDEEDRIQRLVDYLVSARVDFAPSKCLEGPMYASNVIRGPPPLWERFGISFPKIGGGSGRSSGLQGQQYRYRGEERMVVNYAEVLGPALHVRAYGTYERDRKGGEDVVEDDDRGSLSLPEGSGPMGGRLSSILGGGGAPGAASSRDRIRCPADFVVSVNKASIFALGRSVDIPISGTGYLRVLYADPRIRIFVSPKSTTDDRWEKAGLMVAQVRVDLVEGAGSDFADLFDG